MFLCRILAFIQWLSLFSADVRASQHDTNPMPAQRWTIVGGSGKHSFNTGQCFLLAAVCPQYKMTQLKVGPALQVLVSIYSTLGSALGWRQSVHIVYTLTLPKCRLNVGHRRRQWPDIGPMQNTPTHCRLNRKVEPARRFEPKLGKCWPTVCDDCPHSVLVAALGNHRVYYAGRLTAGAPVLQNRLKLDEIFKPMPV